jgi:hypothetical protein
MKERDRESHAGDVVTEGESTLDPGKLSLTDQLGKTRRVMSSVPGRSIRTDGLAVQRKASAGTTAVQRKATTPPTAAQLARMLELYLGTNERAVWAAVTRMVGPLECTLAAQSHADLVVG